MNNTTYYQKNREVILNKGKDYDEINKQKLRETKTKRGSKRLL